jgi:hypothetical protein
VIDLMDKLTISQAFEIAIGSERALERLFKGLEAKFANQGDLAAFWALYAFEETRHAEWLEELKAKLTPEQLSGPVDPEAMHLLRAVIEFSVEKALDGVKDLEDAYQLVSEIESGETNAIFEFLQNNFEANKEIRSFLRAQLGKHVARLSTDLPIAYKGILARREIKALE